MAGDLVVNGSFEEGPEPDRFNGYSTLRKGSTVIKGWEVTRSEIDYIGTFWRSADGARSIDLNGYVAGGIGQTIRTQRGRTYRVTFSMAGVYYVGSAVKKLAVSAAGRTAEFEFDTAGSTNQEMRWVTRTWEFVAVAEETLLEFSSTVEGANGPSLDRVSVVPVAGG